MNEPVLDHLGDIDAAPAPSWGTTALGALLILTAANLLVSYGLRFMTPYFIKQVQEGLRTAGDVVAIMSEIRKAIYVLLAAIVGVWWGRLLAKNQELAGGQVLLAAFGVGALSSGFRFLISAFIFGLENIYPARALIMLTFVFESATFASIVFATAAYRRGKGCLPGILAVGCAVILIFVAYFIQRFL